MLSNELVTITTVVVLAFTTVCRLCVGAVMQLLLLLHVFVLVSTVCVAAWDAE